MEITHECTEVIEPDENCHEWLLVCDDCSGNDVASWTKRPDELQILDAQITHAESALESAGLERESAKLAEAGL